MLSSEHNATLANELRLFWALYLSLGIRETHSYVYISGPILGLRPANERRRYFVTTSLIGWVQA